MTQHQFIVELLAEISYRSDEGYPILTKKEHIHLLSEILTEWGFSDVKDEIISNLLEAGEDKQFKNPVLNKVIKYKTVNGEDAEGKVGNLLRRPKEEDAHIKAVAALGGEGSDTYKQAMTDLGGENQPGRDIEKEKGGGEQQQTQEPEQNVKGSAAFSHAPDVKAAQKSDTEKTSGSETQQKTEENRKVDSEKVEKQIRMTKKEAAKSQKGVGMGTAESRTGESVTVYAGRRVKELLESGSSYEDAKSQIEKELIDIANNPDSVLTKDWVKSGLSVLDYLNDTIGIDSIENFAWDTPEGNQLVGSEGHGTSADIFVKTNDGKTIGISLKKGFKVFIVNGGYGTALKEFEKSLGVDLPKECQPEQYIELRNNILSESAETLKSDRKTFESVADKLLKDPEQFNKNFGPKPDAIRKRKKWLVQKVFGLSNKDLTSMSEEQIDELLSKVTPNQFVDAIDTIKTGDDIKFFAAFCKDSEIEEKHGIYGKLRGLDSKMADSLYAAFEDSPERKEKMKEKIVNDTHIIDTLFPQEPLNDFKTIFGEDPAVEMDRESLVNIFGIKELYDQYNKTTDSDEKSSLRKKIEEEITKKLVVTKKKGVPVIAVKLEGPPQSELPLYQIGVRTRGIGNAPTLEVSQSTFGSLALKNGNTEVETWDAKDRKKVVDSEVSDVLNDIEDETLDLDQIKKDPIGALQDLTERIQLLKKWDSKNPKLKKLLERLSESGINF